jgi:hypothetical protein
MWRIDIDDSSTTISKRIRNNLVALFTSEGDGHFYSASISSPLLNYLLTSFLSFFSQAGCIPTQYKTHESIG